MATDCFSMSNSIIPLNEQKVQRRNAGKSAVTRTDRASAVQCATMSGGSRRVRMKIRESTATTGKEVIARQSMKRMSTRNGIVQCWIDQKNATITNAIDVRPVRVSRRGST